MKKNILLICTLLLCTYYLQAQSTLTPLDADSKVHFVIKNFGIKTGGDVKGLKGTIKFYTANPSASAFDISIDPATIDTDNGSRDESLRKEEYFDVAKYKSIDFVSTKIVLSTQPGRYYVYGNLTIKGVTKPVEFGFSATPKNGGYLFEGGFKINRRDFGVGGSSVSMSDNVNVELSVFAR